jgi:hypothetical protein
MGSQDCNFPPHAPPSSRWWDNFLHLCIQFVVFIYHRSYRVQIDIYDMIVHNIVYNTIMCNNNTMNIAGG